MTEDGQQDREIGERLRAARERAGQSQFHVAAAMTMTRGFRWHQTTLGKVESGTRPLKLTEAAAVAEIIGIPLADLVSESPTRLERGARLAELARVRTYLDAREDELRG